MTTPSQPVPTFGQVAPLKARPQLLWWLFAAGAVMLALLMWKCGSALYEGRGQANAFVHDFHEKLNSARYEEIYEAADQGFTASSKHEDLVKFLAMVHTKLGNATAESLAGLRVNATTNGSFLIASYNTTFDRDAAVETFTWIKRNGAMKLYGYNVQSNALVVN